MKCEKCQIAYINIDWTRKTSNSAKPILSNNKAGQQVIDPRSPTLQLHVLQEHKHPTSSWPKLDHRTKRRRKIFHTARNLRRPRPSIHRASEKTKRAHTLERARSSDITPPRQRSTERRKTVSTSQI